jgi:peptidoglycan/xylan/chitin deacetylase (PgdA/CDA1 family)
MYHDVVEAGDPNASGFQGKGPGRYKLDWTLFEQHLHAIAEAGGTPGKVAAFASTREGNGGAPLFLTFDDGGLSAGEIGTALARRQWTGHFFVPVDFIGRPGFLDEAGIAALARMGHVIGTHSCSHPIPMSRLSDDELVEEWRRSIDKLSQITGDAVTAGSVPGGYGSSRVAGAAAKSGLDVLFTSEPVITVRSVGGCLLLGRYAILAGTPAATAARLARGDRAIRLRQLASWKAKGVAKAVLGDRYRSIRTAVLERS